MIIQKKYMSLLFSLCIIFTSCKSTSTSDSKGVEDIKISKKNADGSFDIECDNGTKETITPDQIRSNEVCNGPSAAESSRCWSKCVSNHRASNCVGICGKPVGFNSMESCWNRCGELYNHYSCKGWCGPSSGPGCWKTCIKKYSADRCKIDCGPVDHSTKEICINGCLNYQDRDICESSCR